MSRRVSRQYSAFNMVTQIIATMMKVQQTARNAGIKISMLNPTIVLTLAAGCPHAKLHFGSSGWRTSDAGVVARTLYTSHSLLLSLGAFT